MLTRRLFRKLRRASLFLGSVFILAALFSPYDCWAAEAPDREGVCPEDLKQARGCNDSPPAPGDFILHPPLDQKSVIDIPVQTQREAPPAGDTRAEQEETRELSAKQRRFVVYFFWGKGCPHCEEEKTFLESLSRRMPHMEVRDYEVWYSKDNANLLSRMASAYKLKGTGVPVTFIGHHAYVGFNSQTRGEIDASLVKCAEKGCIDPFLKTEKTETHPEESRKGPSAAPGKTIIEAVPETAIDRAATEKAARGEDDRQGTVVDIPAFGATDVSGMSLPVMTIIIAGLDSFNPCAFFVLFSLLGLLVHAQSRRKMALIGSVFVFFSGFIYFLFMSAWLNLFLVMGKVALITKVAGAVSILIAGVNIKDFFAFRKGLSLTIPDGAKPRLFDRMRRLMKSTSLLSILVGTAILAIAANSYELLCTAGFPMVFTRILTLKDLSASSYYLYLVFYNLVYIIPLSIIVTAFTITLGKKKLTEWQGRVMKLVSGTMMLGLGVVLLFDPSLLNNVIVSLVLVIVALCLSTAIAFLTKKLGYSA